MEAKDKKVKIKYIKSWHKHKSGIKTPNYHYKKVSSSHYKRYYNTLCVLAGVGGCARNMLDYCCERMDNNNIIPSNSEFRRQFIQDVNKWTDGDLIYTDASVKRAIYVLTQKELLLKTQKRGSLKVNPEYFFKGSEVSRINNISMILEFNPNTPITNE